MVVNMLVISRLVGEKNGIIFQEIVICKGHRNQIIFVLYVLSDSRKWYSPDMSVSIYVPEMNVVFIKEIKNPERHIKNSYRKYDWQYTLFCNNYCLISNHPHRKSSHIYKNNKFTNGKILSYIYT